MGLFDWFAKKTNVELASDHIWLTDEAKLEGIASEVTESLSASDGPVAILLVAHFADRLRQLQALVQQRGFAPTHVIAAMASDLTPESPQVAEFAESEWVSIIAVERHPLAPRDASLVAFARTVPCRCTLEFHLSLNDPLMKSFAGDWVRQVLSRLGMTENQAIESRMVTRRLQQAQLEIARRATGDMPANSAEEWFERNCPTR